MSYLLKLKESPKVPYTVAIAISTFGWSILCAAFGYFLILSYVNFEATGTRTIFIFSFPIYVIISGLLFTIRYGGLRFFGIKEKRRELRVLNDNVKAGNISSNLTTKTLKEIFNSIIGRPRDVFPVGAEHGGMVIFLALLTEWLASGQTTNLFFILVSGLITLFLVIAFNVFFAQRFIFSALKQCRELLLKRGEKIKEPRFGFNSLRVKFNLFLLIPIVVVLTILSFVFTFNLNIIIFAFLGLVMAIIISRLLASSIYEAFLGIKNFAKELPTKKRTLFSTGSLDTEIIDLSEGLNKAADEVYTAREELEEAKATLEVKVKVRTKELEVLTKSLEKEVNQRTKELQKRVDELERFHKLTVGRELKMIELKKEIKKLEEPKHY